MAKKKTEAVNEGQTTETPAVAETEQANSAEQQALAQVNQIVSNSVASLMDVANLLRDIPKLVAANQALSARVRELESAE